MKRSLIAVLILSSFASLGQERLSREESLKYAVAVAGNLKEMLNTPIATDPDIKRPVGYRDGDYGALMLPESKLSEGLARLGSEPVPVGQVWMVKLAPMSNGDVVPQEKLRKVHVAAGEDEADAIVCVLAIAKEDGQVKLLIYGKGKEPVLKVPLKDASQPQENPLDFTAQREDDSGVITVKIAGKYEGSFKVTDPTQN